MVIDDVIDDIIASVIVRTIAETGHGKDFDLTKMRKPLSLKVPLAEKGAGVRPLVGGQLFSG